MASHPLRADSAHHNPTTPSATRRAVLAGFPAAGLALAGTTTAGLIAKLEHAIEINGGFSDRVDTVLRGVIAQLRDGHLSMNGGMA